MRSKPDYGIDAPAWLLGSSIGGLALLALGIRFSSLLLFAVPLLVYAAVHLWSSKVGKRLEALRLLDAMPWRGDERVLDVGCGRGLLLVEAAKRLNTGTATGIDIWAGKDQWKNSPEAALRNAEISGVRDRVEVGSADARSVLFEDGSFDVVLSSTVIHNIKDKSEQARAIREMVRVLRPGGRIAIVDIARTRGYARELVAAGMENVRRTLTPPLFLPGTARVTATKPR